MAASQNAPVVTNAQSLTNRLLIRFYSVSSYPDTEWLDLVFYCTTWPHPLALWASCGDLRECEDPIGEKDVSLVVKELEHAAKVQDADAIITLIAESDRLYLAPERSAVQVLNCSRTGVQAQVALGIAVVSTILGISQD